jgi:hypothetical protein
MEIRKTSAQAIHPEARSLIAVSIVVQFSIIYGVGRFVIWKPLSGDFTPDSPDDSRFRRVPGAK